MRAFKAAWISQICYELIGKGMMTHLQRSYLIGKIYNTEKMANGASDGFRGNQYVKVISTHTPNSAKGFSTAAKIGNQFGISGNSVLRDGIFVSAMEVLERLSPGITIEVFSGLIKTNIKKVTMILNASSDQQKQIAKEIRYGIPCRKSSVAREKQTS